MTIVNTFYGNDEIETLEDWKEEYKILSENPPEEGDYLGTLKGTPIKLEVEFYMGKAPLIFTRAYVPQTVGQKLGWFVQGFEDDSMYGWKCILCPKSRMQAMKRFPDLPLVIPVQKLRVLRPSRSASSFVCEVADWAPDNQARSIIENYHKNKK